MAVRISGFFLAVVLTVFGLASAAGNVKPAYLADSFLAQVGSSVGVEVGVAPNPVNTLAQQLQDKQAELAQQEDALKAREQAIQNIEAQQSSPALSVSSADVLGAGILLFLLIGINFAMDVRRARREARFENTLGNFRS